MADVKLSDKMIRVMLESLLTRRTTDGRYEVITTARTTYALETRGMVEREEYRDNNGDMLARFYLTADGVTRLRDGFAFMMSHPDAPAAQWHRAAVRADWRIAKGAAELILGSIEGAHVVSHRPYGTSEPTVEDLNAEQTVVLLATLMRTDQPTEECGGDGVRPATRIVARRAPGFPMEVTITLSRPLTEEEQRQHDAPALAESLVADEGNYLVTKSERGGKYVSRAIVDRERAATVVASAIIAGAEHAQGADGVTLTYEDGTTLLVARTFDDGAPVVVHEGTPVAFVGTIVRASRSGCFTVREPQHNTTCDYPAEELQAPRVWAVVDGCGRVLDIVEADDGTAAEEAHGAHGVSARPATTEELTRHAQAAELLGDGERFMRHWTSKADASSLPVDREGAMNIVTLALHHGGWTVERREDGVSLVAPEGSSSYLLTPIVEEVSAPLLKREPWRGGQFCGRQTTYGMGAYSERYCGAFKAPGEVECAEHARETREQYGAVRVAPGNARGLTLVPSQWGWSVYDGDGNLCASADDRAELERSYGFALMWEPREDEEPVEPTEEELLAHADAVASLGARFGG